MHVYKSKPISAGSVELLAASLRTVKDLLSAHVDGGHVGKFVNDAIEKKKATAASIAQLANVGEYDIEAIRSQVVADG